MSNSRCRQLQRDLKKVKWAKSKYSRDRESIAQQKINWQNASRLVIPWRFTRHSLFLSITGEENTHKTWHSTQKVAATHNTRNTFSFFLKKKKRSIVKSVYACCLLRALSTVDTCTRKIQQLNGRDVSRVEAQSYTTRTAARVPSF